MLDFIRRLFTPLWYREFMDTEPIKTNEVTDNDGNVVITEVDPQSTAPQSTDTDSTDTESTDTESTDTESTDTEPIDSPIVATPIDPPTEDDPLMEECDAVIDNIMWDKEPEHMDLEEFLGGLNNNAKMSLKQRDQMGRYVSEDLFKANAPPPKKGSVCKKRRNLRFGVRRDKTC